MFLQRRINDNPTNVAFGALRQPKFYFRVWKKGLKKSLFPVILGAITPFIAAAECPPDCEFKNPVDENTFLDLLKRFAEDVRTVAVPFAVVAIIFVGFKFVTASASGNPAETAKARKLLKWVVVGSAIIVGATVLVDAVINTMKAIRS